MNAFENTTITFLDQGVIINGCRSEAYEDEVLGLIITPRCDIANKKVKTVHYLPMIPFDLWMFGEGFDLFAKSLKSSLKGKIKAIFQKNIISINLLDRIPKKVIEETYISKIKSEKVRNDLLDHLTDYEKSDQVESLEEKKNLLKKYPKQFAEITKPLSGNNLAGFYLVFLDKYHVINLREIKTLQFEFAERLCKGEYLENINEVEFKNNDIHENPIEGFLYAKSIMKSPYIEHVLQQFFHCFGRIGIDGFDNDTSQRLIVSLVGA